MRVRLGGLEWCEVGLGWESGSPPLNNFPFPRFPDVLAPSEWSLFAEPLDGSASSVYPGRAATGPLLRRLFGEIHLFSSLFGPGAERSLQAFQEEEAVREKSPLGLLGEFEK